MATIKNELLNECEEWQKAKPSAEVYVKRNGLALYPVVCLTANRDDTNLMAGEAGTQDLPKAVVESLGIHPMTKKEIEDMLADRPNGYIYVDHKDFDTYEVKRNGKMIIIESYYL